MEIDYYKSSTSMLWKWKLEGKQQHKSFLSNKFFDRNYWSGKMILHFYPAKF